MKKIAFKLLIIGLFLSLGLGCEKDEPITINRLILQVSASEEVCLPGNCVEVFWQTKHASSVTMNGVDVALSGDTLIKVTQKTDIQFIANPSSEGQKPVLKEITIEVIQTLPGPTVSVSVNSPIVEYGGRSVVNITTNYADSLVTDLPGVAGLFGSFMTPPLTSATTYQFTVYNKSGEASDEVRIEVEGPTHKYYLSQGAWRKMEIFMTDVDSTNVDSVNIDSMKSSWRKSNYTSTGCYRDDRITFCLNPQEMIVDEGEDWCYEQTKERYRYIKWSLEGSIISGFGDRKIAHLDADTLICVYKSTKILFGGVSSAPIWVGEIYIHSD